MSVRLVGLCAGLAALVLIGLPSLASAASCSGNRTSTGFSFACDTAIAGSADAPPDGSSGFLLAYDSTVTVTGGSVTQPAGVTCTVPPSRRGPQTRLSCDGPRIPAGQRVVGKVSLDGGTPCGTAVSLTAFLLGFADPETGDNAFSGGALGPCLPSAGGGGVAPVATRPHRCLKGYHYNARKRKCVRNKRSCRPKKGSRTPKAKRRCPSARKPTRRR